MSTTVSIAARSSVDGYGKPTYGTDVTYRAHLSRKRQLVSSGTGEVIESLMALHLNGSPLVLPDARITLSTGDAGSTTPSILQPDIKAVERRADGAGAHHTVIYLVLLIATRLA